MDFFHHGLRIIWLTFLCLFFACQHVVNMEDQVGPLEEGVTYEITPPPDCPYPPIRLKFPDDFPPYVGWEDETGTHRGLRDGNHNAWIEYNRKGVEL